MSHRLWVLLAFLCQVSAFGDLNLFNDAKRGANTRYEYRAVPIFVNPNETSVPIKHTFQVLNTGDVPWHLSENKRLCGCTRVKIDDRVTMPGQFASVLMEVDVEVVTQSKTVSATLATSDPGCPTIHLYLECQTYQSLRVDVKTPVPVTIFPGETTKITFDVIAFHPLPTPKYDLQVVCAETIEALQWSDPKTTFIESGVYRSTVSGECQLNAPEVSSIKATVSLASVNAKWMGRLSQAQVPINKSARVRFSPEAVLLRSASQEKMTRALELMAAETFQIKDYKTSGNYLKCNLEGESKESNRFFVTVVADTRGLSPGVHSEWVQFVTNHPRQPIVRVPVLIQVVP